MLAIAVGAVGMSADDFDGLTLPEFEEIYRAWTEKEESRCRNGWEMARFGALYALAPHSRKKLRPQDICTFEWERKGRDVSPEDDRETVRRTREMLMEIDSISSGPQASPGNGRPSHGEQR